MRDFIFGMDEAKCVVLELERMGRSALSWSRREWGEVRCFGAGEDGAGTKWSKSKSSIEPLARREYLYG